MSRVEDDLGRSRSATWATCRGTRGSVQKGLYVSQAGAINRGRKGNLSLQRTPLRRGTSRVIMASLGGASPPSSVLGGEVGSARGR